VNDELERICNLCDLILKYYSGIRLEGLRKTTIPSMDSRSPGRDLNPGPPKYEAGMLTTGPRLSVDKSME
jgi:hypothetical protein